MKKIGNMLTRKKEGGVGAFIAAGVIILIVIGVGVGFKNEIATFVTSFITNATQQANANFFTT